MTATIKSLVAALNTFTFQSIWNEIYMENRVNIELTRVSDRYASRMVRIGFEDILLPPGSFMVYATPHQLFFGGLEIPKDTWLRCDDVLHTYKTNLLIYPATGRLASKQYTYIYRSGKSSRVVVIVQNTSMKTIVDDVYVKMFLTVYTDSSREDDITVKTFTITAATKQTDITACKDYITSVYSTNPHGTTVLWNGYEIDPTQEDPVPWKAGDVIDVIRDDNVVGSFTETLSVSANGFFSEKDAIYKKIIHVPKAINPLNRLLTHNTCSFYVRKVNENKGLYLHRCDPKSVTQITHNDFGLSTTVLDAYKDILKTQDISIHVKVRTHRKDNVLMQEQNYIKILYSLPDAEIKRHLMGNVSEDLSFWRADQLETCGYTTMLFDSPNATDKETLDLYVETFGYLPLVSLLAGHISTAELSSLKRFTLVDKPYALQDVSVTPLVWIGSKKIRQSLIDSVDTVGSRLAVSISPDVYITPNQQSTIVLLEGGSITPIKHIPSINATTITVPYRGVKVFEEVTLSEDVNLLNGTTRKGYKQVAESQGTLIVTPGTTSTNVVFGPSLYGKTLLVVSDHFCESHEVNVDALINNNLPITIPLEVYTDTLDMVVPILGISTIEVYVNGQQTPENIGFTCRPIIKEGCLCSVDVVISAMECFSDDPGNIVEVIYHTSESVLKDTGYVLQKRLSYDRTLNVWYPAITRAYARGELLNDITDKVSWLETSKVIDDGSPYSTWTTVPYRLAKILKTYDPSINTDRLSAINRYLNKTIDLPDEPAFVQMAYRLYSPYITQIAKDLIDDVYFATDDPDEVAFLAQFEKYIPLRTMDPTIDNPLIDTRFVDIFPLYRDQISPGNRVWKIVRRLADLTLPNDTTSLGDAQNG